MQKFKTLRTKLDHLEEAQLLEKLAAADPTGKWVSDFVHSDDPKFAGKSKKERIKMALGASYAAKRAEGKIKEEVEELDEISQNLALNTYAQRAARADKTGDKKDYEKADKTISRIGKKWTSDEQRRAWNRADKLIDKQRNEEAELDEGKYGAFRLGPGVGRFSSRGRAQHQGLEDPRTGLPLGFSNPPKKDEPKKDEPKKVKEESEQIDELSKTTLASYAKKATRDARMKYATGKDFERHARTSRKPEYKAGAKEWEDKYKSDARRREAGVGKAIDRLAKEEVEHIDETPKVDRGLSDDDKVTARTSRAKGYTTGRAVDMGNTSGGQFRGSGPSPYKDSKVAQSGERKGMITKSAIQSTKERIKSRLNKEDVEIEEGLTKDTGWKPIPKERKDEYGNPIKTQNVPKRLAKQGIPKKPMKEETEDKPGIHKVSVTINDKDKDDRDFKVEKMLKVKASNQAAALKIAKSHYGNKGYKVHNASYHGIHEEGKLSSGAKDPCWKGYEMVGTKKKNGKEVPNCVPKK